MSAADNPAAHNPGPSHAPDALLGELSALLRRLDPVPRRVIADAERAGLLLPQRGMEDHLALAADSALRPAIAGMRGATGSRRLRFRCGNTVVEIELVPTGPGMLAAVGATRRAGGGAGTVTMQWPGGTAESPVDGTGAFRFKGVPAGPLRVLVRTASGTAASEWFTS